MGKVKDFFRSRRRTRKQAAFENGIIIVILLLILTVMMQKYIQFNSVESAVERWCKDNYFGEGEICAVISENTENTERKSVYLSKENSDRYYYEAIVHLDKKYPLTWTQSGYSYNFSALTYKKINDFSETLDFKNIEVSKIVGDLGHSLVRVKLIGYADGNGEKPVPIVEFTVDIDSKQVMDSNFRQYIVTDDDEEGEITKEIWLSDERMVLMAEVLS